MHTAELLETKRLMASFRYREGDKLLHVRSGKACVVLGACYIEKNAVPAYMYHEAGQMVLFVRPQSEMEDGRFTPVIPRPAKGTLSDFLGCPEE